VKGNSFFQSIPSPSNLSFSLFLTLTILTCAQAQTAEPAATATPASAIAAPTESDATPRRIARARSLAAVGKLAAAASELESLRAASADESVRDVTRVLLMWIFVEMPDYSRANALLEETFKERAATQSAEAAASSYYALAGQAINGVRAHLERYRTFGLNVADSDLPTEAMSDLDQLRVLLERVVDHAKTLHGEETTKSTAGNKGMDATALLEDAASVRLRLVRNEQERARWQGEVSSARQRLVSSETRIASISAIPVSRPASGANANPASSASDANGTGAANKKAEPSKASAPASAEPKSPTPTPATGQSAASPQPAGAPVAVGLLVSIAKQKSSPSYPALARTARVAGVVTVHLVVNEKGEVESVLRADGPAQLQNAASDAARRWKFHPTVINGQPVRVTGYISFNFAL
jgi:TonB family protein